MTHSQTLSFCEAFNATPISSLVLIDGQEGHISIGVNILRGKIEIARNNTFQPKQDKSEEDSRAFAVCLPWYEDLLLDAIGGFKILQSAIFS